MKKTTWRAMSVLAALAVFTFTSCAQMPQSTEAAAPSSVSAEDATKPVSDSSSESESDMQDIEDKQDDASLSDVTDEDAEAIDPEVLESEPQSQADALPAQANPEPAVQPEQQETAGIPAQEPEPIPPAAEITIVTQQPEPTPPPVEETPAPVPEPEPTPEPEPAPAPAPEPAPAPAFDVSAYVQNAMNYGVGIGLTLDSTATGCWDNPITANERCLYIERDLHDALDWYKASGFTAFWVWAEADGNGGYLVYIGYA